MNQARLRVVEGTAARADGIDALEYQVHCVDAYIATWVARSFSKDSIANTSGVLRRLHVHDVNTLVAQRFSPVRCR